MSKTTTIKEILQDSSKAERTSFVILFYFILVLLLLLLLLLLFVIIIITLILWKLIQSIYSFILFPFPFPFQVLFQSTLYALLKLLMINGVLKNVGLRRGFVKHGLTYF